MYLYLYMYVYIYIYIHIYIYIALELCLCTWALGIRLDLGIWSGEFTLVCIRVVCVGRSLGGHAYRKIVAVSGGSMCVGLSTSGGKAWGWGVVAARQRRGGMGPRPPQRSGAMLVHLAE